MSCIDGQTLALVDQITYIMNIQTWQCRQSPYNQSQYTPWLSMINAATDNKIKNSKISVNKMKRHSHPSPKIHWSWLECWQSGYGLRAIVCLSLP